MGGRCGVAVCQVIIWVRDREMKTAAAERSGPGARAAYADFCTVKAFFFFFERKKSSVTTRGLKLLLELQQEKKSSLQETLAKHTGGKKHTHTDTRWSKRCAAHSQTRAHMPAQWICCRTSAHSHACCGEIGGCFKARQTSRG